MENGKNTVDEESYWNNFYASHGATPPSQFCALVATELQDRSHVVEFGCGNGRDSLFLAGLGHNVTASDLSATAVAQNTDAASGMSTVSFYVCDVSDRAAVVALMATARESAGSAPVNVYNRFFLHSLDEVQQHEMLSALAESFVPGDRLFAEFRSAEDAETPKIYEGHYRRYIELDEFCDALVRDYGLSVQYRVGGRGMAKYREEDPFVARVIATT